MNQGSGKPPMAPGGKGAVKEAVLGPRGQTQSQAHLTWPGGVSGGLGLSDVEEGVVARPREQWTVLASP